MKRLVAAAVVVGGLLGLSVSSANAATLTYDFSYVSPNGTGFTDIVMYAEGEGQSDIFLWA